LGKSEKKVRQESQRIKEKKKERSTKRNAEERRKKL
jgi:hypothetical protein